MKAPRLNDRTTAGRPRLRLIQGGRKDCAGDMDEERREWRAELLERAPGIVARGCLGSEWWRDEFRKEFGRDPTGPLLRLVIDT